MKTCNDIKLTKMEIELDLLVNIYITLRKYHNCIHRKMSLDNEQESKTRHKVPKSLERA